MTKTPEFQPGTKVRRTGRSYLNVISGDEYVVASQVGPHILLVGDEFAKDCGDRRRYLASEFEAVGEDDAEPPVNPRDAMKSSLLGHRDRIAAELGIATEFVTITVAYNASV